VFDHLLNLLLYRIQIEGSRIRHRWIVHSRERELLDKLLDYDETPDSRAKKSLT
jgi:hypothetical protein